jgi:hypothetical protein
MLIIDTNVVSELMRPDPNRQVVGWLSRQKVSDVHMTALTVAEITYGLKSMPDGKRQRDLETRFRHVVESGFSGRVLAFDKAAARHYGEIMVSRRAEGRSMSVIDGQIAAIARTSGATLATRNVTDFEDCNLTLLNPFEG